MLLKKINAAKTLKNSDSSELSEQEKEKLQAILNNQELLNQELLNKELNNQELLNKELKDKKLSNKE